MSWIVRGSLGGDPTAYDFDGQNLVLEELAAPQPLSDEHLGCAGDLTFETIGDDCHFDLRVRRGDQSLSISNVFLTRRIFAFLPEFDAVVIFNGASDSRVSRRIVLITLTQLREALDTHQTHLDLDVMDSGRIIAASHGLDLSVDNLRIVPVIGSPEFILARNRPMASPAVAELQLVHFPFYRAATPIAHCNVTLSQTLEVNHIWMNELVAGPTDDGLGVTVIGVVRKRNDFSMGLATLAQTVMDSPLTTVARTLTFDLVPLPIELRNTGSVESVLVYPDGQGCLVAVEDPQRKRQLFRIRLPKGDTQPIELSPLPRLASIEPRTAPRPRREHPAAAPSEPTGAHVVAQDGIAIALGLHPLNAPPWPKVYVVGDGVGANLRIWLSRGEESDGHALFTLHARSDKRVEIEVLVS